MDFITFKSFIPEIFLSIVILIQLVFNSYMTNNAINNFPLISKELFSQLNVIFFCLLLLFLNLKIEGVFNNFLFLNDHSSQIIKIFFNLYLIVTYTRINTRF